MQTSNGAALRARPPSPAARGPSLVRLLDVDPDLASGLSEDDARTAAGYLTASTTSLPRGQWDALSEPRQPASLGVLVVGGFLARRAEMFGGRSMEILGRGDMAWPWDSRRVAAEQDAQAARWEALTPVEIAWLDGEFSTLVLRWPTVVALLVRRALQRTAELSCELAISHVVGVGARLVRLFAHLADRWGTVTPRGVTVPIPLTNAMLGEMIGARAPSVGTALQELARNRLVLRGPDGSWLLEPDLLAGRSGPATRLGPPNGGPPPAR